MSTTIPNQGPAITPFTPPESCLRTTTFTTTYSGVPAGFTLGTDEDCFPPATREFLVTSSFVKLYSPGVCPGGYAYASPFTKSVHGQDYDDSVTRYLCCPESYTASYLDFYSDDICVVRTNFVPYATSDDVTTSQMSVFAFDEMTAYVTASAVIVAWQESDQAILDELAERGVAIDWPPANAKKKRTILLATLVPIGVVLVSLVAGFYWLYRTGRIRCAPFRRGGKDASDPGANEAGTVIEKPELDGEARVGNELDGQDSERRPNNEEDDLQHRNHNGQGNNQSTAAEADSRALEREMVEADSRGVRILPGPAVELPGEGVTAREATVP